MCSFAFNNLQICNLFLTSIHQAQQSAAKYFRTSFFLHPFFISFPFYKSQKLWLFGIAQSILNFLLWQLVYHLVLKKSEIILPPLCSILTIDSK